MNGLPLFRMLSAAAAALVMAGPAAAQGQLPEAKPKKAWQTPRTTWGDPDLQGIWPSTNVAGTPFERPKQFGDRRVLTDQEFAARAHEFATEQERVAKSVADGASIASPDDGQTGGGPAHWGERWLRSATRLTSLLVDPPDGQFPPMTADGRWRAANQWRDSFGSGPWHKPDDLGPYDRCITRGVVGSMFPSAYNNGNEIIQSPGYVAIRNEMVHETRVIPVDGRPHLPSSMRSYMGDSRGRWEGDTLVVETINFNGRVGARGNGNNFPMSESLRLVERFTRLDADTLQYEVTIDDPQTWTRPWTVAFPYRRDPAYHIFEYACHEGNYAMKDILSGARSDEKAQRDAETRQAR
jgi:hypothetical protein